MANPLPLTGAAPLPLTGAPQTTVDLTHEELVQAWVRGWAVARGTAPPVWDRGGWRVEVGAAQQVRRFVFPTLTAAVQDLAGEVREPYVFIKVCADREAVRTVLPPRFAIQAPSFLMVCRGQQARDGAAPPAGYALTVAQAGAVVTARVVDADGGLAALGHAIRGDEVTVYDRIVTEAAHRRRGLGRAVMLALEAQAGHGLAVLVATLDGAALYRSMGWVVEAPYTSAVIGGE